MKKRKRSSLFNQLEEQSESIETGFIEPEESFHAYLTVR